MKLTPGQEKAHLNLFRRAIAAATSWLRECVPPVDPDEDTRWQRIGICATLCEMLGYAQSVLTLSKAHDDFATSAAARSILEMQANIVNLIADPKYAYYLHFLTLEVDRKWTALCVRDTAAAELFGDVGKLALEETGQTFEQMRDAVMVQQEAHLKRLAGTKYLSANGSPLDQVRDRFKWAGKDDDYVTLYRHLSRGTHPVFLLGTIEMTSSQMTWPPHVTKEYPLLAVDLVMNVVTHTFSEIAKLYGADATVIARVIEDQKAFYKHVNRASP